MKMTEPRIIIDIYTTPVELREMADRMEEERAQGKDPEEIIIIEEMTGDLGRIAVNIKLDPYKYPGCPPEQGGTAS